VPQLVQFLRELKHLRDLHRRMPLVDQAQRLVVQELVRITLGLQEGDDLLVSPLRPVVLGEHHIAVLTEQLHDPVDVIRPGLGVAGLGAAQRVGLVQRVRGVLRRAQRPQRRDMAQHFRRRLGVGR
jgi:hypothetical protein